MSGCKVPGARAFKLGVRPTRVVPGTGLLGAHVLARSARPTLRVVPGTGLLGEHVFGLVGARSVHLSASGKGFCLIGDGADPKFAFGSDGTE